MFGRGRGRSTEAHSKISIDPCSRARVDPAVYKVRLRRKRLFLAIVRRADARDAPKEGGRGRHVVTRAQNVWVPGVSTACPPSGRLKYRAFFYEDQTPTQRDQRSAKRIAHATQPFRRTLPACGPRSVKEIQQMQADTQLCVFRGQRQHHICLPQSREM